MLPAVDTTAKAAAIKAAVRKLGMRGAGRRYPETLKREVLAYLAERRKEGRGYATVSAELGIPRRSLKLWSAAPRQTANPRFVAMTIGEAAPAPVSGIVVHAPGGLRIEGLDLGGLVELLRRLAADRWEDRAAHDERARPATRGQRDRGEGGAEPTAVRIASERSAIELTARSRHGKHAP
jgi:hypothetical protein